MTEPSFSLKSVDSSVTLEFVGAIPAACNDWDGRPVDVTISGGAVQATATVYDVHYHEWAGFFATLASDWHSLPAPFAHESLEGHLQITAAVDRAGHVELRVRLRGVTSPTDWMAEDVIALEVGQLDAIAARARAFFI